MVKKDLCMQDVTGRMCRTLFYDFIGWVEGSHFRDICVKKIYIPTVYFVKCG